jgi:hypothetical protein
MCEHCQARPTRYHLARLCHDCKAAARERDLARNRARNREYRQRKHDAGQHKPNPRQAENARILLRLQREREGRPLPALSVPEYHERYGRGYGRSTQLPAAPLRPLIERALESESEVELGRRAAVADRRLREILTGKQNISLVTADRLCVALGFTLSVVYQEAA